MTPAAAVRSSFSIFIASITTRPWPALNRIANGPVDANDEARHWREERGRTRGTRRGGRQLADGPRALVERLDVVAPSSDRQAILSARLTAAHGNPVNLVAKGEHHDRRTGELREMGMHGIAVDADPFPIELDLDRLARHFHDVFHAASGTSSHTVSTCAVCGNMSNEARLAMRKPGSR